MIGRGEMFYLLTERAHSLEFAVCRGKPILDRGHGIGRGHKLRFHGLQKNLQCMLFPLCVKRNRAATGALFRCRHGHLRCGTTLPLPLDRADATCPQASNSSPGFVLLTSGLADRMPLEVNFKAGTIFGLVGQFGLAFGKLHS
jgi:hypothetical protein